MLGPCSSRSVYPGTSGTKPTLGGPGCRLPSLPRPPTRPTSSPDVYTGWSGPLPAWDRLNKHTGSYVAPASSFPQTAVSQAGLPQAPPPHPRSPVYRFSPTDYVGVYCVQLIPGETL